MNLSKIRKEQEKKENSCIQLNWDLVENIYLKQYRHLRQIAYRRLDNLETAEDAVQDTMEVICKKVNEENTIYNLDAWVYTILKYKCLERFKSSNRVQYFENDKIEEMMMQEELEDFRDIYLYEVFGQLEKMDREIVIYKFIYGFHNTEISKIYGCSYAKVKESIDRSLEILKTKLILEEKKYQ